MPPPREGCVELKVCSLRAPLPLVLAHVSLGLLAGRSRLQIPYPFPFYLVLFPLFLHISAIEEPCYFMCVGRVYLEVLDRAILAIATSICKSNGYRCRSKLDE